MLTDERIEGAPRSERTDEERRASIARRQPTPDDEEKATNALYLAIKRDRKISEALTDVWGVGRNMLVMQIGDKCYRVTVESAQ